MFTRCRMIMLLLAAAGLLGGALLTVFSVSREPSYQGKSLSKWVGSLPPGSRIPNTHAVAIRTIGTNAIPYLLQWIQHVPSVQDKSLASVFGFKHFARQARSEEFRADNVARAFEILGSDANDAIPELTRLLNTATSRTDDTPYRAARALGGIGKAAIQPLTAMLTNRQEKAYERAFFGIAGLGTNALPVVPILIQCLTNENRGVVANAIVTLGWLELQPDLVVPALTNFLVGSRRSIQLDTMEALEQFGPVARPAVPILKKLLNDSQSTVWEGATNALLQIAPETLNNTAMR